MSNSLLQIFFGCGHRNTTFPITPIRRGTVGRPTSEPIAQTYIACLDCGAELAYDWQKMRRVKSSILAQSTLVRRRLASPFRLRSAS